MLNNCYTSFVAAVALYIKCKEQMRLVGGLPQQTMWWNWMFTAGKEACVMAYDVGQIKNGIAAKFGDDPVTLGLILRDKWKQSSFTYQKHFPFSDLLRDAAAHSELTVKTPEKFKAPAGTGMSVIGSFFNDYFTYTFKGHVISLSISFEKAAELRRVVASFFEGFSEIASSPQPFQYD